MELKRCSDCANGAWTGEERTLPKVCTICRYKSDGAPSEWKPKVFTNADRIRSMSDDEFSCFLALVENRKTDKTSFDDTSASCLEYLKQPAEE